MAWLIIVAVLLLAIGPILMAMPSAKDKRLAALRAQARQRGLSVQMTQLPHPTPTAAQQVSAAGVRRTPLLTCAAYRLPLRHLIDQDEAPASGGNWRLQRRSGAQLAGLPVDWEWFPESAARDAPDGIAALPATLADDVLAIEGARGSVAVYWQETPGIGLDKLVALLHALREIQQARS